MSTALKNNADMSYTYFMKASKTILCVADHVDPLVYSKSLKQHFGHVDAVFSCGDLKRNYYEYIVSTLNVPFVYVLGNHSPFSIEKNSAAYNMSIAENLFGGGMLADGKSVYLKEQKIIAAGFGGSIRYNNGDNQYTEFEMCFRILKLLPVLIFNRIFHGRYLDVFITHAPPRHINDKEDPCHRGFKSFRWFLRTFKPQCMIHGHVHLYNYDKKRVTVYEGIPVINVYDHYLLHFPVKEDLI